MVTTVTVGGFSLQVIHPRSRNLIEQWWNLSLSLRKDQTDPKDDNMEEKALSEFEF